MAVPWDVQQNLVIAFSFIGFVLVSIPSFWHFEAWNIGCLLFIFWTGSQCLIQFVSNIVWRDNAINWAPPFCDITSRWLLASSIGIPTASLLINRRLYRISSITVVHVTAQDKRRAMIIDLAIGLGIPFLQVALYWFIQGHRFDIFEGFGCLFVIPNTYLAWFLYDIPPIIIGVASATYGVRTIHSFLKRRRQLEQIMSNHSSMNWGRYARLMALATVDLAFTLPLSIYTFAVDAGGAVYPWKGLSDLHYGFSAVDQYPAVVWRADQLISRSLMFDQWSFIGCALLFFVFFGLAEEARKHYSLAYEAAKRRLGIRTTPFERIKWPKLPTFRVASGSKKENAGGITHVTIPTFLQRPTHITVSISPSDFDDGASFKEYVPSRRSSSSGSGTCVSNAHKEKPIELSDAGKRDSPLPSALSLADDPFARPMPDVPISINVCHSIDMV